MKSRKILVLGTRGFPGVQGGVETHCENLFTEMASCSKYDIEVITRSPYIDEPIKNYEGVKLKHLFAPKIKSLEAIIHSLLGVFYARVKNPDILHIHAIGPSLVVFLAKLLGMKVVVTNHGPDYNRKKWGKLAKIFLRLGERIGSIFADKIIVISEVIKRNVEKKYNRYDTELIYNGVELPSPSKKTDYLESIGVQKGKYIFTCGRFVEEKGFHDLISAYEKIGKTDRKLVIAGDADHETKYSRRLVALAKENNIILTGFIKGEKLNQLFTHAELFVLPSYHEGLPIALLEAMSYNLNVLVSDIPANKAVNLEDDCYFETGNIDDLASQIQKKLKEDHHKNYRKIIEEKYNWKKIADQTAKVYEEVLSK